jgi:hypothetical protein
MQLGPKGAGTTTSGGTSNYGKSSFQRPEPEQDMSSHSTEIPIIEETDNASSPGNPRLTNPPA